MVSGMSSKPSSASASASAAAASAAAAAGGGAGGGLAGWWARVSAAHGPAVQERVRTAAARAKTFKWSMPVDVKVDFLRPTVVFLNDTLGTVWASLPPPAQAAAPYVGVAAGSGLVVFAVQQRRLGRERARGDELKRTVAELRRDKEDLVKKNNLLRARASSHRPETEARLAAAVAEATNAAAAAADAAARAATACIIRPAQALQPKAPGVARA